MCGNEGGLFFHKFRERQKQKRKAELEIYQVGGGVGLMWDLGVLVMVNAIRCAVLRLLYCFHGRALFCFACIGMLICFLVIGVLVFLSFYMFYSTLLSCDILDGLVDW